VHSVDKKLPKVIKGPANVVKKTAAMTAAQLNAQPLTIMIRVQHKSKGKLGEDVEKTYDLPATINMEKKSVTLKNTFFFKEDRSTSAAQLGFLLGIAKFLMFYTCICGMLALPTERGVRMATQLFVVPTIVKSVAEFLEKLGGLLSKLLEIRSYRKMLTTGKFFTLLAFAKKLKKARNATCPYMPLGDFMEGVCAKGPEGNVPWTTQPSVLSKFWLGAAKKQFGADAPKDDVKDINKLILKKLVAKQGSAAAALSTAAGMAEAEEP
jgi:hypothetical protein